MKIMDLKEFEKAVMDKSFEYKDETINFIGDEGINGEINLIGRWMTKGRVDILDPHHEGGQKIFVDARGTTYECIIEDNGSLLNLILWDINNSSSKIEFKERPSIR